jgi:hypothetical protein
MMAAVTKSEAEKTEKSAGNGAPSAAATTASVIKPAEEIIKEPHAERNVLVPAGTWPPPIYVDAATSEQEKYYMEHRWYAQWEWYDQKATFFKKRYLLTQLTIGIVSGIVPALVAINSPGLSIAQALQLVTIGLSLVVTAFTVWENVYKHGDNWRSYRGAAEELAREKVMYDMRAGQYKRVKNPFMRFVERCEDIIAKQNGQWLSQMAQDDDDKSDDNRDG